MSNEETTNTTNTTNKTKPAKTRPVPATPQADGIDAFGYEMLEADSASAEVDPKTLIFPTFDSRSDSETAKLDPSFAEDVKNRGILQPPLVTPVRELATGKTGYMVVAGRQRVRAAIAAGNAKNRTIPVHVKTMTLREAVVACGIENMKRKSLSFWDTASYMLRLKTEFGMKQTEIKTELGVADSNVSQHLAVFDLDERVQKLVRKGQLDPGTNTKVRALKAIVDLDQQYATALKAIEGGWTSDDLEEAVARIEARMAEKEKAAKERAKAEKAKGARTKSGEAEETDEAGEADAPTFDPKSFAIIKKAEFSAMLESVATKIEKMRAKEGTDPTKLAYERGRLDGLKQGAGLKALPKSIAGEPDAE